jgi:hypothetical protein
MFATAAAILDNAGVPGVVPGVSVELTAVLPPHELVRHTIVISAAKPTIE